MCPISLHVCMRCLCGSLTHSHPQYLLHTHSLNLAYTLYLSLHTHSLSYTHNLTDSHAHAAGNNGNIIIAAARRLETVGELEAAAQKKNLTQPKLTYEANLLRH